MREGAKAAVADQDVAGLQVGVHLSDTGQVVRAQGRRGDVVKETMKVAREVGAEELHVSADWSAYARRREQRLATACAEERIGFTAHPGITIVEPGAVTPTGGDHFRVFSPYHRAWSQVGERQQRGAPRKLTVPSDLNAGRLPATDSLTDGELSPAKSPGWGARILQRPRE